MRWSEATALRPGDWDLDAGVVRVSRAWKDSKAKGRYLGAPKTRKSKRTIAIPPGLVDVVRPLVEARGEFVFTNRHGNPIIQQTFYKEVWDPARNLANGKPAFATTRGGKWDSSRGGHTWTAKPAGPGEQLHKQPRIHDLRHTHASWLINAGVPLPVIQQRLGHESITTTVDRYGHLSPDNLTMAAIATQVAMAGALPEAIAVAA
jgi:integrase